MKKIKNNQRHTMPVIRKKSASGITLIALVVTIVVLLILAGVSISMLGGENGIIKQAVEAKDNTRGGEVKEEVNLAASENNISNKTGLIAPNSKESVIEKLKTEGKLTNEEIAEIEVNNKVIIGDIEIDFSVLDGPPAPALPGKIVTGVNTTYTDSTGIAIIPVGFAVVTNPDTIENGLVISDEAEDDMENSKRGNQFVWIPVPDFSKFHLIEGYLDGSLEENLSDATDPTKEAGSSKTQILPGKPNLANNILGTDESVAMYKSVQDNKGFYIARFEAGIANTDTNGNPVSNRELETKVVADGTIKPLSQKNVGLWSYIAWGGTKEDIATDGLIGNDNADGAVKVARSMYTKSRTCGVTSTLCYGVQWDAIMNFIDANYYKMDGSLFEAGSFVANSTNNGVYESEEHCTGNYEIKHIYDLGGNAQEWVMSARKEGRELRGGVAAVSGYYLPASSRTRNFPDAVGSYFAPFGFRVALYL